MTKQTTAIYLVCYHSEPGLHLDGSSGQFAIVENAILAGEWPYDNGDDPSFHIARRGGPLTWGVCRQELRNSIKPGSIVVFFSFMPRTQRIRYRLTAAATVTDTLDRRVIFADPRFRDYRDLYLNLLIKPTKDGWRYGENDRERDARHKDWLWRIAIHGRRKESFKSRNRKIYSSGRFADGDVLIAANYILFSPKRTETYIATNPPKVAEATKEKGATEIWSDSELRRLTVEKAGSNLDSGRDYLRVPNLSGRNVHRQIRFTLPSEEAVTWRQSLISALRSRDVD
ncbi:MAG: hypothetical protein WA871_10375 [Candidatus Acidiferrales bacterium]